MSIALVLLLRSLRVWDKQMRKLPAHLLHWRRHRITRGCRLKFLVGADTNPTSTPPSPDRKADTGSSPASLHTRPVPSTVRL